MATGYQLQTPLEANALIFARLIACDRLGEPFRYEFHLLSEDGQVAFEDLLGQPLSLTMDNGDAPQRHFHGIVTEVSYAGRIRSYEHYVAIVRPTLWLLKQSADCRIFQSQSVAEIIKAVLNEMGVTVQDKLTETYPTVEYCVQYRESHFDFISRLMEQAGIYYYFVHSSSQHEMVLIDASSSHAPIEGASDITFQRAGAGSRGMEYLWDFQPAAAVTTGTVILTDYDFEKPRVSLEVRSQQQAGYELERGVVFDYPGKHLVTEEGDPRARVRCESLQIEQRLCRGEGNVTTLATGGLFTLASFPRTTDEIEYLVLSHDLEVEAISLESESASTTDGSTKGFIVRFEAIPATTPYRKPRQTARPVVGGPHTAVVVGKQGEEIWTDQYGRIKVQFHWDRLGNKDEQTTCWLRVAQSVAGARWGSIHIPRIGQEVIVQFLEGDPDRPLVTGSLYNDDLMPPYELPANMTQSGIKTRSTKDGTDENYNELRFEDKKDEEEIYVHAERDFNRVVENNDTLKVGFDKMEQGDQTIDIYNNRTVTLDQGDDTLQLKNGNRSIVIDKGDSNLQISEGSRTESIENDDELTVHSGNHLTIVSAGDHSIKIETGKSLIEAGQEILLKVGDSSIKITPQEITITAMKIEVKSTMGVAIDGGMEFQAKGTMATLESEASTTVKGGVVMIN